MTPADAVRNVRPVQHGDRLVAGRYLLQERIGHGRLGEIHAAGGGRRRDTGGERRVAIQILPRRSLLDEELFEQLGWGYGPQEYASHPNIVRVFEFGRDANCTFLAMELLEGTSLRSILADVGKLPMDDVLPIVRGVGDALEFLHARSAVHGEVTSGNVFVTFEHAVKLLDIAPLLTQPMPAKGLASGGDSEGPDVRDDVLGLACLTYEMLSGRHPFDFQARAGDRDTASEPPRIPSMPDRQWRALSRGLSLRADRRAPTVAEFLREFGVTGTEVLPPADAVTADAEPAPVGTPVAPVLAQAPAALPMPPQVRSRRRRPSLLLLMLLGLGAWTYFGQPERDVAAWMDLVAPYVDARIRTAVPRRVTPKAAAPAPVPPVTAAPEAASPESGPIEEIAVPVATAEGGPFAAAEVPEAPSAADAQDEADTALAGSAYGFTVPEVRVSEHDGVASITVRRTAGAQMPVYWWTSDQTAVAGKDYIATEQPVRVFTDGGDTATLLIPLIDDALPELPETFFVHLGSRAAQQEYVDLVSSARVIITDDD
jgi:Calx-beta domain/Protein tyrosine and serine/threonine kinase